MLKKLVNLANHLDKIGLRKEASHLDLIIDKYSSSILKISQDQHGMFQHFQSGELDYDTRDEYVTQRMKDMPSSESLYGVFPEQEDATNEYIEPQRSLSTRYSPDRVGVQARRIGDGVYQDPYTNKIYDYNEGFKSENGEEFIGGTVEGQTGLYPM